MKKVCPICQNNLYPQHDLYSHLKQGHSKEALAVYVEMHRDSRFIEKQASDEMKAGERLTHEAVFGEKEASES